MSNLVNIYNDSESAIIIDESSTSLTEVKRFATLGESPFNTLSTEQSSADVSTLKNLFFVEMHIFDTDENLVVSLNSARPLLKRPSDNTYYFGDYHLHNETYMTGKKHTAVPHEVLVVEKMNQFIPYPLSQRLTQSEYINPDKKFAIKISEIFQVMNNLYNFNLTANDKFSIEYGVFQDLFLLVRHQSISGEVEF